MDKVHTATCVFVVTATLMTDDFTSVELHHVVAVIALNTIVQDDSKLLSGFLWPIILKPKITKKTAYEI
jgi:hypothetical protein